MASRAMTDGIANEQRSHHRFTICVAVHVILAIFVTTRAWYLQAEWAFIALASLPMAQCSLVVLWGMNSRVPDYVRFPMTIAAVFGCWYELSTLIAWSSGGITAMLWVVLLGYQSLLILITAFATRLVSTNDGSERRFSFRIRTLQLWTAAVAIAIVFFNFGQSNWGWSTTWMRSGVHVTIASFAFLNATVACVWALAWQARGVERSLWRGTVCVLVVAVISWLADHVIRRWGVPIGMDTPEQLRVASVVQSLIVGATILAVGRHAGFSEAGRNSEQKPVPEQIE